MLNKITALFKGKKPTPEDLYKEQCQMLYTDEQGFIVGGIVLNDALSARLEYLSNRRLSSFNDLSKLYDVAIIINEKIDLEIANQRFIAHLGNTEENLLEFKQLIKILTDYYRNFQRVRK